MRYTIKKGKHRGWPPVLGLYFSKRRISRIVKFERDCVYYLPAEDAQDVNKLFGIGYNFNHHEDSARFGWVYDDLNKNVMLMAYCYINGERIIKELLHVPFEAEIQCNLNIVDNNYIFEIITPQIVYTEKIPFTHKKWLGYPLGLYFGGNRTAPKDMHIHLRR